MAMVSKLWSISALATEFCLDRRTVAKRIDGIAPAGKDAGSAVWALADVAPALASAHRPKQPDSDVPQGAALLDHFAAIPLRMVSMLGPKFIAEAAVADGMERDAADRLFETEKRVLRALVDSIAKVVDLPPLWQYGPPIFVKPTWAAPDADDEGGEE